MEAKQIIHCLKLISLLQPFSHIFSAPWLQASVTATPLLLAGEKVKDFIRSRCQNPPAWAGTEWWSLSAVVRPDCCPGIFPSPRRFKDNAQKMKPWFCWSVCLPHCRKCWWEGDHTSSKVRFFPQLSLCQLNNSYCIIQSRKRTYFLWFHGIFYSLIFSF